MGRFSILNTTYRKNNLTSFKALLIFLSSTMFKLRKILDRMQVPDKHVTETKVIRRVDFEVCYPTHPFHTLQK